MSFNRTSYDTCDYDMQIKTSTDPGDYRLSGFYAENQNQCYSYNGPIGSKVDVSVTKELLETCHGSMAAVESNLSWRSNKNTQFINFPVINKPICSPNLTPQDTRFTNPVDNYRGMSLTDRMVTPFLHTNPQCVIQEIPDHVGTNTRLQLKDCFNNKIQMTKPPSGNCNVFPVENKCIHIN